MSHIFGTWVISRLFTKQSTSNPVLLGSMIMILYIVVSLPFVSSVTSFRRTIVYLDAVATVVRRPTPEFMHEIKAAKRFGRSLKIKMRL